MGHLWPMMLSSLVVPFSSVACASSIVCTNLAPILCSSTESMNFVTNAWSTRNTTASPSGDSDVDDETLRRDLGSGVGTVKDAMTVGSLLPTDQMTQRNVSRSRTKTVFLLRYPPPNSKQKQRLYIRPKILLQLHQTSQGSHPIPVFDVLRSFAFASTSIRKLPRVLPRISASGEEGVVIVSSEDYMSANIASGENEDRSPDDRVTPREVVATISIPSDNFQGSPDICLNSGGEWKASRLPKGGYEFVSIDEHGLKKVARWIPRHTKITKSSSSAFLTSSEASSVGKSFNFSLIDSRCRQHAVIASLNAQSIDVWSHYTRPSSVHAGPTAKGQPSPSDAEEESEHVEVDELLRKLIVVSGLWVAFTVGFSPNSQYEESASVVPVDASKVIKHQRRSLSLNLGESKPSSCTLSSVSAPTPNEIHRRRSSAQQRIASPVISTSQMIGHSSHSTRRAKNEPCRTFIDGNICQRQGVPFISDRTAVTPLVAERCRNNSEKRVTSPEVQSKKLKNLDKLLHPFKRLPGSDMR